MKISCTPISLAQAFKAGMTIEDFINFCAELELDAVDIMDTDCYPWQWHDKEKELAKVSSLAEKAGLKIAAVACGNDFTKKDDSEFEKQVTIVKRSLRNAAEIGAPLIRIFGGKLAMNGGELPIHEGLDRIIQGVEACLTEAEKLNVILAIENHGGMPGHSYEIEALMKHFNSPYFKCTFDCANFIANNMDEVEDTLVAYECLKDHIAHCHIKDFGNPTVNKNCRVEACVAGKGLVPIRQFAALLEKNNYSGYCSLEYEASSVCPEEEGVPESLDYLKKIRAIHNVLKG